MGSCISFIEDMYDEYEAMCNRKGKKPVSLGSNFIDDMSKMMDEENVRSSYDWHKKMNEEEKKAEEKK